jgi:hypothetical protein
VRTTAEQRRPIRQGTQQRPHQRHINHRGLVDDQQTAVERRLLRAAERPGARVGLE